jgi:outer membrane immunogenic protein
MGVSMRAAALAIVTSLAISAAGAPALAADLPAKPYAKAPVLADPGYNWSGFYIGVNAGYGFADRHNVNLTLPPFFSFPDTAGSVPTALSLSPRGFIGGAQAGYNWQFNRSWLFGLEADLNGTDIRDSSSFSGRSAVFFIAGTTGVTSTTYRIDWFGTVRARIGFLPIDRLLIYGTGGLAYGDVRSSVTSNFITLVGGNPNPGGFAASASDVKVGWTAGVGSEFAVAQSWSIKAEYLYYDLGVTSYTAPFNSSGFGAGFTSTIIDVRNSGHIVKAGLNYHFGGPVVAKY